MGSLPDMESLCATGPRRAPLTSPVPDAPIVLQHGEGLLKADVVLTAHRGEPVVLKDYRRYAGTWMALPARLLLRRERRMLERLRDWPHSPRVVGHLGKLGLLLEYVPGEMLGESLNTANPLYFTQLMAVIASLHAASIVHNDVRGSNIIVSRGRLVLIDFASALRLPGGRALRFLLRPMRRSDLSGALKFKRRLTGEAPTEAERRLGRKPGWIRGLQRLWKGHLLPRLKGRAARRRD